MGELAALFHDLHSSQATASDVDWYVARLPRDAGTLLVAGGDAGRLLLAFCVRGLHAHGIDSSQAALVQCERRLAGAGQSAPLFRQDLDTLNLPFRYAGAMIGASMWQAVHRARTAEALQRLRAHFVDPGVLIIECVTPEYAQHPPGASIIEIERVKLDDGSMITRRSERQVDAEAQRMELTERYERRSGAAVTMREDARATMAWYTSDEMLELVHDAGFANGRVENLRTLEPDEATRFAVIASL